MSEKVAIILHKEVPGSPIKATTRVTIDMVDVTPRLAWDNISLAINGFVQRTKHKGGILLWEGAQDILYPLMEPMIKSRLVQGPVQAALYKAFAELDKEYNRIGSSI